MSMMKRLKSEIRQVPKATQISLTHERREKSTSSSLPDPSCSLSSDSHICTYDEMRSCISGSPSKPKNMASRFYSSGKRRSCNLCKQENEYYDRAKAKRRKEEIVASEIVTNNKAWKLPMLHVRSRTRPA